MADKKCLPCEKKQNYQARGIIKFDNKLSEKKCNENFPCGRKCHSSSSSSSSSETSWDSSSDECRKKDKHHKKCNFCCGEGYIVWKEKGHGKCNPNKNFRSKIVSEVDPEVLNRTLENLKTSILYLLNHGGTITPTDIYKLGIACENSAVTMLPSIPTHKHSIEMPVGIKEVNYEYARLLNQLKVRTRNVDYSYVYRIVDNDIVHLVITLVGKCKKGRTVGIIRCTGMFHIIECGTKICIDEQTCVVHFNRRRKVEGKDDEYEYSSEEKDQENINSEDHI